MPQEPTLLLIDAWILLRTAWCLSAALVDHFNALVIDVMSWSIIWCPEILPHMHGDDYEDTQCLKNTYALISVKHGVRDEDACVE